MNQPALRGWFETFFCYEGSAVLTFHNRDDLTGTARIEVNEDLVATTTFRVTPADYKGPEDFATFGLLFALSNLATELRGPNPPGRPNLFRVQVPGGEVHSLANELDFGVSFTAEGPGGPELLLRLARGPLEFVSNQPLPAAYFVLPLVNYVAHWVSYNPDLDSHPLRLLRPVRFPEGFSLEHPELAAHEHQRRNGMVEFEFRGRRAFIQPVDDYDERRERLEAGVDRARITALLVGDVADNPITWPELQSWLPAGLMGLLSLATGSEVEGPWIELRASDGTLLRRLHFGSLPPIFGRRGHIIDESIHRGTGRFLSQALRSPHFGKPHLYVAVSTICERPDRVLNLDDRLRELIVALEALANGPGVGPDVPKRRNLTSRWRSAVEKILSNTRDTIGRVEADTSADIERLAQEVASKGDPADAALLSQLAALVHCTLSDDRSFAAALRAMLLALDLPDAHVLDPWFRAHPAWKRDWISVIRDLRASLVHRGSVGVGGEGRSTSEIVEIVRHLEDLLVRVVFRLLEYDGLYQPAVVTWPTDAAVGWVTERTSPAQLGFTSVGYPGQGQSQEGGPQ